MGDMGNELLRDSLCPLFSGAEIANQRKGQGTKEVDEEILHRVIESDIQIPAGGQYLPVYRDAVDPADNNWDVSVGLVQQRAGKLRDDGVLLHIHEKQTIHGKLKKLPQHADRHGKAERCYREISR